jgi:glycine/serine hydroxymethyltransferase
MGTAEMELIAGMIDRALTSPDDDTLAAIRREVEALSAEFPLYEHAAVAAGRR